MSPKEAMVRTKDLGWTGQNPVPVLEHAGEESAHNTGNVKKVTPVKDLTGSILLVIRRYVQKELVKHFINNI